LSEVKTTIVRSLEAELGEQVEDPPDLARSGRVTIAA
jgi:hypothetical protein